MWRGLLFLSLLVLAPLSEVVSQALPLLGPGDRVRLVTPQHQGVFQVTEWTPPTLRVRDPTSGVVISIPTEQIERLEIRRGTEARSRSMFRGMGIGALVGGGLGIGIGLISGDDPEGILSFTATEKAVLAGTVLGVTGGVGGGLVGLARPRSRWEPLVPGVSLMARCSRGPARRRVAVEGGGYGAEARGYASRCASDWQDTPESRRIETGQRQRPR